MIRFLYPNEEQKEILAKLDNITKTLAKPPSPNLKKNIRFINNFTEALFLTGKKLSTPKIKPKIIKPKVIKPKIKKIIPKPLPPAPAPQKLPQKEFNFKKKDDTLIYEPKLHPLEKDDLKIYNELKTQIAEQVMKDPETLENDSFINNKIKEICKKLKIKYSDSYSQKMKEHLTQNLKGFGKLEPLIQDPRIKSITCNSYNNITVSFNNEQLKSSIKFSNNTELENFIKRVAIKYNKQVSEQNPNLEVSLPNFKISAIYNPIMGSSFTITKS